jgi:hypothetical protein
MYIFSQYRYTNITEEDREKNILINGIPYRCFIRHYMYIAELFLPECTLMWHLRPAELEKDPAHWEQLKSFSLVAFPPDLKINYKLYGKPDVPIILV